MKAAAQSVCEIYSYLCAAEMDCFAGVFADWGYFKF
jgi:hypothetical protein